MWALARDPARIGQRVRRLDPADDLRRFLAGNRPGEAALELVGLRVLHCIGDSHTLVFRDMQKRRLLKQTLIDVTPVFGATALGLNNPNSRTDALKIFTARVAGLAERRSIVFLLGEVDCGYLIWYRSQKSHESVEAIFDRSFSTYTQFLESVAAQGHSVIVCAIPLPTISNLADWNGLDNARSEITVSLQDRTAMTMAYNQQLRTWCGERTLAMIETDDALLDPDTQVVRATYLNEDSLNHHLADEPYGRLLSMRLRELGYE